MLTNSFVSKTRARPKMTVTSPDWPWYVAEYVMSESLGDEIRAYQLHLYLIHATSAEVAFREAVTLQASLGDVYRDKKGNVVTLSCLGLHALDTLQECELKSGALLSVINWPTDSKPFVRKKDELSLFRS